MNFIGGVVVSGAIKAAEAVLGYASEAAAGHLGYKTLTNIKDNCADAGASVAGDIGRSMGNVFGKVLAGNALPAVAEEKKAVANAVRTVGTIALDASSKKNQSGWMDTAWKAAKCGAIIGGGILAAANAVPLATVAIGGAVVNYAPEIIKAIRKDIEQGDQPHFVDNVIIPGMKQFLFAAAGTAVGNYVRFDTVETAFNNRIVQFSDAGKAIGSYLPNRVAPYAEKLGQVVGKIDAGRYAMSDEMIDNATSAGNFAQNVVQTGLEVGDSMIAQNKPNAGWKDTARRVFWLGTGVLGAGALVALAPEVAALTGGVAAISVASEGIRWVKAKMLPKPAVPIINAGNDEKTKAMQKIVHSLIPQAELAAPEIATATAA